MMIRMNENRTHRNIAVVNGTNLKAVFDFGRQDVVECKLAISPVSIENARLNLRTETDGKSFDAIKSQAYEAWNKELGKMQVESGEHEKEIFYTALYHTMIQPNVMSDANGEYMAADYSVRRLPVGQVHYSTFSLWDTFRAAHPLYTMLEPERSTDFVNSMIRQYDYYGYLPIWQLWGQDNYCMIGNHAVPVVVDAILKGLPGIDVDKAYEAVKMSLTTPHLNSPFEVWDQYGYMPEDLQTQSVSITLEQSFDDWCAAQLAKHLNKAKDYEFFMKRSAYYRNLHHPETKFFQPKNSKGEWILPFDPYKYGANGGYPFTEGNGWQYTFFVPQNPARLIEKVGKDEFNNRLDSIFTEARKSIFGGGKVVNAFSGLQSPYNHGNQPSLHISWLFNFSGKPYLTQKWTRLICDEFYGTNGEHGYGYGQDEDQGQLGAMGLFDVQGGACDRPTFQMGSPLFDKIEIKLSPVNATGKTFVIETTGNTPDAYYVQSATLNGKPLEQCWLYRDELYKGGTLKLTMGNQPNEKWGVENPPHCSE